MGYNPRAEWTTVSSPVPQVTHRLDQIQEAQNQASMAMRKAQLGWIKDKEKKQHVFRKGDLVWLDGHNIKTYQPTAKLAPKRHGPFPIQRVLSTIDSQLTLPDQWKIHDVFHVDLLTPYSVTIWTCHFFLLSSFVTYLLPLCHNSPLSSYFFVIPLVHYSLLGPVS